MLAAAAIVAVVLSAVAFNQRGVAQNKAATATVAQGQALVDAATAVAAKGDAQYQAGQAATQAAFAQQSAAAEALARQEAGSCQPPCKITRVSGFRPIRIRTTDRGVAQLGIVAGT